MGVTQLPEFLGDFCRALSCATVPRESFKFNLQWTICIRTSGKENAGIGHVGCTVSLLKAILSKLAWFLLISTSGVGPGFGIHDLFYSTQIQLLFPEEGLVYDYKLDDAGLSSAEEDLEEEIVKEVKDFTHLEFVN